MKAIRDCETPQEQRISAMRSALGIDQRPAERSVLARRGIARIVAPAPDTIYSPGPEWNKKWESSISSRPTSFSTRWSLEKDPTDTAAQRRKGTAPPRNGDGRRSVRSLYQIAKWSSSSAEDRNHVDIKELERNLASRGTTTTKTDDHLGERRSRCSFSFPRHACP